MQNRTQVRRAPLAVAHLMSRHTDSSHDGRPITFRVQADRRQVDTLAAGVPDRRARRKAAASAEGGTGINTGGQVDHRVKPPAADSAQEN